MCKLSVATGLRATKDWARLGATEDWARLGAAEDRFLVDLPLHLGLYMVE